MKIINYISLCFLLFIGMASCKENTEEYGERGAFLLNVEAKTPEATRTVSSANTGNFPVVIEGVPGSAVADQRLEYPSVSSLPKDPILLPVGSYVVSSHSPFELLPHMDKPYYEGSANLEIIANTTTSARVTCKMQNSKFQLFYSEQFKSTFKSWTITVNDGINSIIEFTDKDKNPAPVYCYFGLSGAPYLTVDITAILPDNTVVRDSRKLVKKDAQESYDGDNMNFIGGDGVNLNMDISATPSGSLGVNVTAKIEFTESVEDVEVSVEDVLPTEPEGPTDPDVPGGGDQPEASSVKLELPQDLSFVQGDEAGRPKELEAKFITPEGLASAIVRIQTSSADFEATLKDAAFPTPGALLTGAELIGNAGIQTLFDTMGLTEADGQPKKTPEKNAKEYIFPLSAFYQFLDIFPGTHEFYLTVTDVKGAKAEGKLTITVK